VSHINIPVLDATDLPVCIGFGSLQEHGAAHMLARKVTAESAEAPSAIVAVYFYCPDCGNVLPAREVPL
jgi:hypothetical protein